MNISKILGITFLIGLAPTVMGPTHNGCDICLAHLLDEHVVAGNWYSFDVEIPGGSRGDFIVRASKGNPDLYCLDNSGVSPTNFSCGPQLNGLAEEVCTFEPTASTKYYCIVEANGADSTFTLWVTEADSGCHWGAPGDEGHCDSTCTCGYELGGCKTDADCGEGLECVQDVGANYGWASTTDVCL